MRRARCFDKWLKNYQLPCPSLSFASKCVIGKMLQVSKTADFIQNKQCQHVFVFILTTISSHASVVGIWYDFQHVYQQKGQLLI